MTSREVLHQWEVVLFVKVKYPDVENIFEYQVSVVVMTTDFNTMIDVDNVSYKRSKCKNVMKCRSIKMYLGCSLLQNE